MSDGDRVAATAGAAEGRAKAFPEGFRWGVSVSSHQFEGGNDNTWTDWEAAGHVVTGERSGAACGWWVDADRDLDLARGLGLNALRMSTEWSRVQPEPGRWDEAALARYREIVGGLLDRGLEPMVCLHHFSEPRWFAAQGSFLHPDAVSLFAAYADRVAEALGDLCGRWLTFNEPNVYATMGYQLGGFPPGRRGATLAAGRVMVAMARAHGAAYRAIHRRHPAAEVSWTQNCIVLDPARPARRVERALTGMQGWAYNEVFPEMVATGRTPRVLRALLGDVAEAPGLFDFTAFNYYGRYRVTFDLLNPSELFGRRFVPAGAPEGDLARHVSWGECHPAGIARITERLAGHGRPIFVLENGVADAADRIRPWLIAHAANELHGLVARGVDVRGYYHWSLVDNFEWAEGWRPRFGLAHLDTETRERTLRRSAHLYGAIAAANALTPEILRRWAPSVLPEIFPGAP